ncbi:MAG: sensor histidine kinase, partial [Miltoncostaeaceae bacterium]
GALALVLTSALPHPSAELVWTVAAIGLIWIGAGAAAHARRPDNRTGLLMAAIGFAWLAGALENVDSPAVFTLGFAISALWIALLIHLTVAFPEGRVAGGRERAVTVAGYVAALAVWPARLLVTPSDDLADCGGRCPDNVLLVDPRPDLGSAIEGMAITMWLVIATVVIIVLVRRWRASAGPARRSLTPVLAAAAVTLVLLLLAVPARALSDTVGTVVDRAALIAFAGVPVGLLLGLLRTRMARGAVDGLVVELGDAAVAGGVRAALARSLRDPSLDLAYWLSDERAYVDAAGRRVPDHPVDGRGVTKIAHAGEPIALVTHDAVLSDQRELVDAACAAAGLALANERRQAELRGRLVELRASRARLLAAADGERKRLERDLHDGAQQHLVALAILLRRAETAADEGDHAAPALIAQARRELEKALGRLRELARGIHPAVLTDHGLEAALRSLADRSALPVALECELSERPPSQVEVAAFYVVAEAITNVVKHADAGQVRVTVVAQEDLLRVEVTDDGRGGARSDQGTGLRGLVDRVEAVGGRLRIESPAGEGTRVVADLPLNPAASAR